MVKVKSKKNCKFGYNGQRFVFKEGEIRNIDVPVDKIDTHSFEIIETIEKKNKTKYNNEVKE